MIGKYFTIALVVCLCVAACVFAKNLKQTSRKVRLLVVFVVVSISVGYISYRIYNPTALEQINPEMVWDVNAMQLPGLLNADRFHGMYFAADPDTKFLGPGTRIAVLGRFADKGTDALVEANRKNTPPPPGAFAGLPTPIKAVRIDPTGTVLSPLLPEFEWDWADPTIKWASAHLAPYRETRTLRNTVDKDAKPDWWPMFGDVAKHHTYGNFVPGRPAVYRVVSCTYLWTSNGGMIGGFGNGQPSRECTGPHELILEDFSGPAPRRVGFRLLGQNTRNLGSMMVTHDGSIGYILDRKNNAVWFIPLYKAWDYLDSNPPPKP
jgi:hypothetical protein